MFEIFKKDTWIKNFLTSRIGILVLVIFLGFMTAFCGSGLMFISGYLISKSSTRPDNILLVYVPIVLTRTFGLARPAFRYLQRLASHDWVLNMTSKLRSRLYRTIEKSGIFYKSIFKSGKLLSNLTEDISNVQNLYLRSLFPTITALALYLFILVATGIINIYLFFALFVILTILVFIGPALSFALNCDNMINKKRDRDLMYQTITDNILGILDWTISKDKERFYTNLEYDENNLKETERKLHKFSRNRNLIMQFIFMFIVVSAIIYTGTHFNNLTYHNYIAAFILCTFPMADTYLPLSAGIDDMAMHMKSVENLNELDKYVVSKEKKILSNITELNGSISVKNLTFRYEDDEDTVLENINIDISKNEKVCILGKSGTGKSTLLKILRGDLEAEGLVNIFGIDPTYVDLAKSRIVGVLNQTAWVFHTSIYNNIRISNEELTYEKASEIIEMVGLKDKVESLPNGLNTIIDEGGRNLSGGERQRLALARILAMDVPVIFLDEPTVGLDPLTENELLDTIFKVFKDKTIIWVTHHMQGIEKMDRVLYLEHNKVSMNDSPEKLIKENEFFAKLYSVDKGL